MMSSDALAHPTVSKPSDAASALRFVKKFVEDCCGNEFELEVLPPIPDRRLQKPAPESLQVLGQVIYDFGDQLSSNYTVSVLYVLLHTIKYPNHLGPQASGGEKDACSRSRIVDTETLRLAINALANLLARALITLSKQNWLQVVKTIQDVLEMLTNDGKLVVDWKHSRIYSGLLRCLQLALSDAKGSIGDLVTGFVISLMHFFGYGWTSNNVSLSCQKPDDSFSKTQKGREHTEEAVYKPPHLRRMLKKSWSQKLENSENENVPKSEAERHLMLSDSDQSDSDGTTGKEDRFNCSKTRALAVFNIQALARMEPKSLHAHWTVLFCMPDLMNTRRMQNSLLKTLLCDPILKVRVAAAATISLMLEGPSRAFIRMAEYRDFGKAGSFMTLSFSLGQALLQLQKGLTHLVLTESNLGLLVAILKALALFVGAAPFNRLPNEMLPNIIKALQQRIGSLLMMTTNDQLNAACMALNCIGCTLNTVPPSDQVAVMLSKDTDKGLDSHILQDLLKYAQLQMPAFVRVEALQALKYAIHNYLHIKLFFWNFITPIKHGILKASNVPDMPFIQGDPSSKALNYSDEKVLLAAAKLLNESLRAITGSNLTDDSQDDFVHHSLSVSQETQKGPPVANHGAQAVDMRTESFEVACWNESLNDYLPPLLVHPSALIRAEAMTCFAGLTFFVFSGLTESQRSYIISTVLEVAKLDESSVVRSAACRALGVLVSFPSLVTRTDILASAMDVIIYSTKDPALGVRITASWALANLCDTLRCMSEGVPISLSFTALAECAMSLSKDSDKVRANAARALGNLTRVINFDSANASLAMHEKLQLKNSDKDLWLERVVQTLVSCVTTGNVKVQWNVCHALANLFLNKSIHILDMPWATSVYSILLLLLRDSKNFKIRIQAASALAVQEKRRDYGESFSDVVQALVLAFDALNANEALDPSTFKYANALSEQLTATCLHVLGLTECKDYDVLQDFLIKRESFLENWLRSTLLSASQKFRDGSCLCIENESNEGTSTIHLSRCWIHREGPPRERIWYALNDKHSQISDEKALQKRKDDVIRVCEKLIELYTHGKQKKHAGAFQQILEQSHF